MKGLAESIKKHYEWKGKIEVVTRCPVETGEDLSLAYTPGVAGPCLEIQKDLNKSYDFTRRSNLVAVITDGSAVLGLGNIGPEAGMPVMEGKCALFKKFGNVDAIPICIRSNEVDTIVNTVALIAGSFGGVNLEDISAPRCFEIERRLKKICDIPVFHDDQHGTAVCVAAAMINACRLTGRQLGELKITVNGAGAAAIAVTKLLMKIGVREVIMCNSKGIICEGDERLNSEQAYMATVTNLGHIRGSLKDAVVGANVFIGLSAPNVLTGEMVATMADGAMVFAMANPTPEIMPDVARAAGAAVIGTGRSDFPNQINNVLAFPGIFRGALDVRASDINDEMKIAAAYAIAGIIQDSELSSDYIIPSALDERVVEKVSKAVSEAAIKSGVARI